MKYSIPNNHFFHAMCVSTISINELNGILSYYTKKSNIKKTVKYTVFLCFSLFFLVFVLRSGKPFIKSYDLYFFLDWNVFLPCAVYVLFKIWAILFVLCDFECECECRLE